MKGNHNSPGCIAKNDCALTLSSLSPSNTNLLPCTISVSSQEANLAATRSVKVNALLDTGSLAGDFISQQLVDRYNFPSNTVSTPSIVCSGLNNNCIDLFKTVSLTVLFTNEITSKINTFSINAFILKDTPIDLIVGLSTIKKHSLFQAVPSLVSTYVRKPEPALHFFSKAEEPEPIPHFQENIETPLTVNSTLHASLIDSAERIFGEPVQDHNEIPASVGSFEPWLKNQFSADDPLAQINISGSHEFRAQILSLCKEFKHLFSDTLPPEPAKLKPFDIIVDEEKWAHPSNRTPRRCMAPKAQVEVKKTSG